MILLGERGARVFPAFAMLQLAVRTGHTPASRSSSCPVHPASLSGDFLSHKRGSCVLKKINMELSGPSLLCLLPGEWIQFDLPEIMMNQESAFAGKVEKHREKNPQDHVRCG